MRSVLFWSGTKCHLYLDTNQVNIGSNLEIQRPTAKDLLKHSFVKGAKKTGSLVELIERRKRWKQAVGPTSSDEEASEHEDDDK